ncbi:SET domain containing protein [uncultured Caudovirales phage]|uniref:SET domain containing protein n=1 Tax=uncultured Caudovirales phage TaxID=2100421 RepID=A0A6J5KQW7_9CAUD|nr:SET domain containing protein [uncultured Caudovirales phage]
MTLVYIKPSLPVKTQIQNLQNELLKMPQADIVTEHIFYPGFYERKITIPAWTVLTGAAHKTDYKIRLEQGTIAVNVGEEVKIMTAPYEFEAKAGEQRVGRVFEQEVVWVDVYKNPDNCKDLEVLEERLYVVPECGLGENRVQLEISNAQTDYKLFLDQIGLNQVEMDKIVTNEDDVIDMPDGYFVELKDSKIHGKGLFATKSFKKGEIVCPGRLDGKRTPGGRFINHSYDSNILPIKVGDDIYAMAVRDIYENEELLVDYRSSMRVNFGITLQGELPCQVG